VKPLGIRYSMRDLISNFNAKLSLPWL